MAALRLHEEIPAEKVQGFPVLYELKVLKNKILPKTGIFTRASSN